MQALNSLATPEEKLAALCKKYADLVSRTCGYLHLNSCSSCNQMKLFPQKFIIWIKIVIKIILGCL